MTLSDLSIGKVAIVDQISLGDHGQALITRLEALGITPDKPIRVLRKAWLGGPLHIRVGISCHYFKCKKDGVKNYRLCLAPNAKTLIGKEI